MFDYRYHALSLAAVLFALALGVLIGVAIGDSNLVSSAKNGIVHNLNSEVSAARKQTDELQQRLSSEEALGAGLYPLAVHEQLVGTSIGLVFLGASSDQVNALTHTAVAAGGGNLATVVTVRQPLDLDGIAKEAAGTHYAPLASAPVALVEKFGELMGRQLVSGGALASRELLSRVSGSLLGAFDGQLTRLGGLVVMRADPSGASEQQNEAIEAFNSGLLRGVGAVGIPTVGVELTSTEPSQVPWYQAQKISSVDNLNEVAGQAALVYALAGDKGTFGTKSTADSLLPSVGAVSNGP